VKGISVAYAVGPSVNTLRAQLISLLPNKIFAILFEFLATKFTQKSISSTYLSSESCEINCIK
jgi:hypothetical protein